MDTIKTYIKYIIWIVLFWILSDILIYYGINSTYKDIENKSEIPNQIMIETAEATKVNGRIKGKIANSEENDLSEKYLKIDLYADSGNLLATEYEDIGKLRANEVKAFETYFKMQDAKGYTVNIVDNKEGETNTEIFSNEDMTKWGVLVLLTYMIFF